MWTACSIRVLPALERRTRHVVIIGSIAGLIALPTSPAYSAAKAALGFWVRGVAPRAAREGMIVTIVRPGSDRTPLTAKNPYPMPGLMDAERAARIIVTGIERGQRSITFPRSARRLRLGRQFAAEAAAGAGAWKTATGLRQRHTCAGFICFVNES